MSSNPKIAMNLNAEKQTKEWIEKTVSSTFDELLSEITCKSMLHPTEQHDRKNFLQEPSVSELYDLINSYHAFCKLCEQHFYSCSLTSDINSFFQKHVNTSYHKQMRTLGLPPNGAPIFIWEEKYHSGRCNVCDMSGLNSYVLDTKFDPLELMKLHFCIWDQENRETNEKVLLKLNLLKKFCGLTVFREIYIKTVNGREVCLLCGLYLPWPGEKARCHLISDRHYQNFCLLLKKCFNFKPKDALNGFNLEMITRWVITYNSPVFKEFVDYDERAICFEDSNNDENPYSDEKDNFSYSPKSLKKLLKTKEFDFIYKKECSLYDVTLLPKHMNLEQLKNKMMNLKIDEKSFDTSEKKLMNCIKREKFSHVIENYVKLNFGCEENRALLPSKKKVKNAERTTASWMMFLKQLLVEKLKCVSAKFIETNKKEIFCHVCDQYFFKEQKETHLNSLCHASKEVKWEQLKVHFANAKFMDPFQKIKGALICLLCGTVLNPNNFISHSMGDTHMNKFVQYCGLNVNIPISSALVILPDYSSCCTICNAALTKSVPFLLLKKALKKIRLHWPCPKINKNKKSEVMNKKKEKLINKNQNSAQDLSVAKLDPGSSLGNACNKSEVKSHELSHPQDPVDFKKVEKTVESIVNVFENKIINIALYKSAHLISSVDNSKLLSTDEKIKKSLEIELQPTGYRETSDGCCQSLKCLCPDRPPPKIEKTEEVKKRREREKYKKIFRNKLRIQGIKNNIKAQKKRERTTKEEKESESTNNEERKNECSSKKEKEESTSKEEKEGEFASKAKRKNKYIIKKKIEEISTSKGERKNEYTSNEVRKNECSGKEEKEESMSKEEKEEEFLSKGERKNECSSKKEKEGEFTSKAERKNKYTSNEEWKNECSGKEEKEKTTSKEEKEGESTSKAERKNEHTSNEEWKNECSGKEEKGKTTSKEEKEGEFPSKRERKNQCSSKKEKEGEFTSKAERKNEYISNEEWKNEYSSCEIRKNECSGKEEKKESTSKEEKEGKSPSKGERKNVYISNEEWKNEYSSNEVRKNECNGKEEKKESTSKEEKEGKSPSKGERKNEYISNEEWKNEYSSNEVRKNECSGKEEKKESTSKEEKEGESPSKGERKNEHTSKEERKNEDNSKEEKEEAEENSEILLIEGLPKGKRKVKAIYSLFSAFGKIRYVFFDAKKAVVAFVEPGVAEMVANKQSIIINDHKLSLRVSRKKSIPQAEKKLPSMSQGLIHLLQNPQGLMDFVLNLIVQVMAALNSPMERKRENLVCATIISAVSTCFPNARCYTFGSRLSGLTLNNSDLDVFLDCGGMYEGFKNTSSNSERKLVRKVAKLLKKKEEIKEIIVVDRARVPIVSFLHRPTLMRCDLSFKNGLSVQNTLLIKFMLSLDWRVRPLILFLKYWAKENGLHGPPHFSSYAIAMMVIYYLEQLERPVLPTIEYLQNSYVGFRTTIGGWDCSFNRNIQSLPKSNNKDPLPLLLSGLFEFYANFDYSANIISPLTGKPLPREVFSQSGFPKLPMCYKRHILNIPTPIENLVGSNILLCLMDPFDLSHILTKGFTFQGFQMFLNFCQTSWKLLKKKLPFQA